MSTYILPGMGADSSMYGEAFRNLKGVEYIEWPAYKDEQTISGFAKRIIEENNIQANDIIGGSSLGGIMAAEISKRINLNKIILIGSTLTSENINPILKKLSTFTEIAPINFVQTLAGKVNTVVENKLCNMFSKSETLFIKTMCRAVFEWSGNQYPNCHVAHIHGGKDKVIFPPTNGARIIQDGGHLIAMTHEPAVLNFINENINP